MFIPVYMYIYICLYLDIRIYKYSNRYIFDIPLFCMRKTWICKYSGFTYLHIMIYVYINIIIYEY